MSVKRPLAIVGPLVAAGAVWCGALGSTAVAAPGEMPLQPPPKLVSELTGFQSPTGNVGCYIDASSVRCDIAERDWALPARPADCNEQVNFGQGLQLAADGESGFVCAGDTALGYGDVLAYGSSIAAGAIRCDSAESGITCRDNASGHGFMISRQAYQLF